MARTKIPNVSANSSSSEDVEHKDSSKETSSHERSSTEESGESEGGETSSKKTTSDKETESGGSNSSDSDSDSESNNESKSVSNSKPTKAKRKADSDLKSKDGKKSKKNHSVGTGSKFYCRIWSHEDQIIVLKGFLKYVTEKGKNPYDNMENFYKFIVKSITLDATKTQLVDKIRYFKGRYEINNKKSQSERERNFAANAHERKVYDLCKKIWGMDGVLKSIVKSNGVVKKSLNPNSKNKVESKKKGDSGSRSSSSIIAAVASYLASLGYDEHDSQRAWGLMDESEKAGMKEKWKKVSVAQLKLSLRKGEFINQIGESMVEVLNR